MKSTLIYTTSKPESYSVNALTLAHLNRKIQHKRIKKSKLYQHSNLNSNSNMALNDLMFFESNNDAIEQQKLDILQNSSLPIESNPINTVQSYFKSIDSNCHEIGYYIAEKLTKHLRP